MPSKIALIVPEFHSVEQRLHRFLSKKYEVTSFFYNSDSYFNDNVSLLKRIVRKLASKTVFFRSCLEGFYYSKFNEDIVSKFSSLEYDYLIIIKGYGVSKHTIKSIRAKRKIVYQWDSIARFPSVVDKYQLFDRVFTYDFEDHKQGFGKHLPNFIDFDIVNLANKIKENATKMSERKIFFLGEFDEDRLTVLKKIASKFLDTEINLDLTLVSKDANEHFDNGVLITPKQVDREDYLKKLATSWVVIELPRGTSKGKSQRYYEAIMLGKIVIGDYSNTYSIEKFLSLPYEAIISLRQSIPDYDLMILEKLPLECWVNELINQD
jgi:hypothetical protein